MDFFQKYLLPGLVFQGVVIGGGYATGRELAEFFLPHGRWVVCCPWLLPVALLMASRFGLVTLIAKGYGILTCGFIAVFVVPVLTIGIYRIITLGKSKQMGN